MNNASMATVVIAMIDENENLKELQNLFDFEWNDPDLLIQALTHSSYAHENKIEHLEHNQRLEFLGDAVLELAISDYLYKEHPDFPEGILTKIRAGIVCEPSLALIAKNLCIGSYLLIGKGEERSGGRVRPSILADAMEALIGAVFLDKGLEKAIEFIKVKLAPIIKNVVNNRGLSTDYKTQLQEFVQQKSENPLEYTIIDETGPDHSKNFEAGVKFQGEIWGTGKGRTKKDAEQAAARNALDKLMMQNDWESDSDKNE
jgi:ribonuclease-3